jgi:hypothetical protein
LLQHDNARPHTLQTTMERVEKLDLTIPWHLPYRPDLATYNFHFFSKTEGNPSWTRVCLRWRGRKVCQDLGEGTSCGVLSRQLWETCPFLAKVCREWWWLCGELNTEDKRAHFKNYFYVSFIKIYILKQK